MIYIIDTCFWAHLQILWNKGKIDLRPILEQYQWGITKEIEKEIDHFQLSEFIPMVQAQRIPITEKEWSAFWAKYPYLDSLDKTDQSIILIAIRDSDCILTDDNGIFLEAQALGIPVFLLPLFVINQAKIGVMPKKEAKKCLVFWNQNNLYSQRELKRWKSSLDE